MFLREVHQEHSLASSEHVFDKLDIGWSPLVIEISPSSHDVFLIICSIHSHRNHPAICWVWNDPGTL